MSKTKELDRSEIERLLGVMSGFLSGSSSQVTHMTETEGMKLTQTKGKPAKAVLAGVTAEGSTKSLACENWANAARRELRGTITS